jgi:hypothetical protein
LRPAIAPDVLIANAASSGKTLIVYDDVPLRGTHPNKPATVKTAMNARGMSDT